MRGNVNLTTQKNNKFNYKIIIIINDQIDILSAKQRTRAKTKNNSTNLSKIDSLQQYMLSNFVYKRKKSIIKLAQRKWIKLHLFNTERS